MLCHGKPPGRSGHRLLRGPCLVIASAPNQRLGTSHHAHPCEQTGRMLAELGSFLDLCTVHLNLEDRHYHPALERRRSGTTAAIAEANPT